MSGLSAWYKPRPDDRMYGIAAQASMTGNHTPMRAWLLDKFFEP